MAQEVGVKLSLTVSTLLAALNLISLNSFAESGNQIGAAPAKSELLNDHGQKPDSSPLNNRKCFRLKDTSQGYGNRLRFYRFMENYKDVSMEELSGSPLGCLKKISFTSESSAYLTLGGNYRYRFEHHSNQAFGLRGNFPTNSSLHRFMFNTDLQFESVRAFLQLSYFEESGQRGGPGRFDESEPDIQQGFIDWHHNGLNIRVGRQELNLGGGKKTGIREGANQRRAFDALRTTFNLRNKGPLDVIYAREVTSNPEAFKDEWFKGSILYGIYANSILKFNKFNNFDLFYLGVHRDKAIFNQGVGEEDRHSVGARIWKKSGDLQYNYEATYQFGTFASNDISAWGFVSETSYGEKNLPLSLRYGARLNLASGDKDPTDSKLGTFSVLFPSPTHASQAAIYGPGNGLDIQPFVELYPHRTVKVFLGADFQWRLSDGDAFYANPGVPLVADDVSDERYVGWLLNFYTTWTLSPFISIKGTFVRYTPGDFIKDAGGRTTDFFMSSVDLRF